MKTMTIDELNYLLHHPRFFSLRAPGSTRTDGWQVVVDASVQHIRLRRQENEFLANNARIITAPTAVEALAHAAKFLRVYDAEIDFKRTQDKRSL